LRMGKTFDKRVEQGGGTKEGLVNWTEKGIRGSLASQRVGGGDRVDGDDVIYDCDLRGGALRAGAPRGPRIAGGMGLGGGGTAPGPHVRVCPLGWLKGVLVRGIPNWFCCLGACAHGLDWGNKKSPGKFGPIPRFFIRGPFWPGGDRLGDQGPEGGQGSEIGNKGGKQKLILRCEKEEGNNMFEFLQKTVPGGTCQRELSRLHCCGLAPTRGNGQDAGGKIGMLKGGGRKMASVLCDGLSGRTTRPRAVGREKLGEDGFPAWEGEFCSKTPEAAPELPIGRRIVMAAGRITRGTRNVGEGQNDFGRRGKIGGPKGGGAGEE